jgi:hypothetical protein
MSGARPTALFAACLPVGADARSRKAGHGRGSSRSPGGREMGRPLGALRAALVVMALALMLPLTAAVCQSGGASPAAHADSITIAAGTRYQAGALHRWVAGSEYRDLWVMPIRVPVLDLYTYGGGLHPLKEGGGMETTSLRLETADGTLYAFRLSDKLANVPDQLKNTPADAIYQDQVSALHPAAAVIAAPILDASGVLHPTAVLMVITDDSALGKFGGEFVGRLGMIEEYPNVPKHGPGFGGATKIIDSPALLQLLNSDAREHVDAPAFLAARLTDFLINDNDRHPGNWKWARLASGPETQWEPIARDRDHAFIAFHGWLMTLARLAAPRLVPFGDAPDVPGLTYNKGLDARLLAGLEKPVWDSVARALQGRITDSVIDAAARAMPLEYQATAPQLAAVLKRRRDALPRTATQFYRQLAARVEVHGTDAPDRAVITRVSDGVVDVRLETAGTPWFSRRFDVRETSEILVYLHEGDDTALVTGRVEQSIPVRIIGGNGTNTLIDSSTVAGQGHPTRLYDVGTVAGVSYGLDTLFDRRPWERKHGVLAPDGRDDGTGYQPLLGLGSQRRGGLTPRMGFVRYGYGFDRRPYASMVRLDAEYAPGYPGFRVGITADQRLESSPLHFTAMARMSQLQVVNFSGLGNATSDSGSSSPYFEVHQTQWVFHPAIALAVGSSADISLGPVIQHSVTDDARSPYLSATRPYGVGTFNQAGLQLGVRYDWSAVRHDQAYDDARNQAHDEAHEQAHAPLRVLVQLDGLYFPAVMDVRSAFEEVAVTMRMAMTLPVPTHPYFVMRAGAKKLFGDFPFYEAAFIGGEGTTRYMDTQRYAGDAALYGTSELRIPLAHFKLLVPLGAGIMGLAEAGRVYADGTSPGGWHATTGGGIWVGRRDGSSAATVALTTEAGHAGIQLGLGLHF